MLNYKQNTTVVLLIYNYSSDCKFCIECATSKKESEAYMFIQKKLTEKT